MDIETINKYIELDKQIKNRIVQISNALRGVRTESINAFVPSNAKYRSDLDIRYANDFLENSECDGYLNLAYHDDDYCLCEFNFDKELLCIDDATPDKVIQNQLDKIEKLIIQAAEQKQDFVMAIVPIKVKDKIKEELENEDYTVWSSPIGIVTDEEELKQKGLQYITITWDENLVFFDELN